MSKFKKTKTEVIKPVEPEKQLRYIYMRVIDHGTVQGKLIGIQRVYFKDMVDGCVGALLVFENKEAALKFSGDKDSDILEGFLEPGKK